MINVILVVPNLMIFNKNRLQQMAFNGMMKEGCIMTKHQIYTFGRVQTLCHALLK